MKKSLKALALGLAIVPCALVMTACGGDGEIKIDTQGNYIKAETTEYANVLTDLQDRGLSVEDIARGARLTLDVDADINIAGSIMNVAISSNNYFKNNSENGALDISKFDVLSENEIALDLPYLEEPISGSGMANMYMTGGTLFADLTGVEDVFTDIDLDLPSFKFSQSLLEGETGGETTTPEDSTTETPSFNLVDLLEFFPETSYGEGFLIETSEDGEDYKVRVTLNGTYMTSYINGMLSQDEAEPDIVFNSIGDIVIYAVCDADGLVGLNVTGSVDVTINITYAEDQPAIPITISGDMELSMTGYDGNVDFPNGLNAENYPVLDETEGGISVQ